MRKFLNTILETLEYWSVMRYGTVEEIQHFLSSK